MFIKIDGAEYKLPASLLEVTLDERIAYDKEYGVFLRDRLKEILESEDNIDKELALSEYQMDVACKSVSFFGKIPLDVVRNTSLQDVLIVYNEVLSSVVAETNFEEEDFQLLNEVNWDGEIWQIAPPELKHNSSMTFGEFLDAKQAVKNLFELGNERWEALLMLCCIYLRKNGEKYNESFVVEEGDRYKLMQSLPLAYALHVGFFLSASMHSFINTSPFFSQPESKASQN